MPYSGHLIDMIAQMLYQEQRVACYASVDMAYAYGQIPFHDLTSRLQIVGRESTGTYRSTTGFFWPY